MDPQACFKNFVSAVAEQDFERAAEYAAEYQDWVEKGGVLATDDDGVPVLKLDWESVRCGQWLSDFFPVSICEVGEL